MKKRRNAYLTVEAALVVPIVLFVQVMAILLLIFEYDRCLLEQDAAKLIVSVGAAQEQDSDSLTAYMQSRAEEIYLEKYVLWEMTTMDIRQKGNTICVQGGGELTCGLPEALSFGGGAFLQADTVYEAKRIHPCEVLRAFRKVKESDLNFLKEREEKAKDD